MIKGFIFTICKKNDSSVTNDEAHLFNAKDDKEIKELVEAKKSSYKKQDMKVTKIREAT